MSLHLANKVKVFRFPSGLSTDTIQEKLDYWIKNANRRVSHDLTIDEVKQTDTRDGLFMTIWYHLV
jgi:hypothetical protein